MTEDRLFETKGRVAVHMAPRDVSVPPGETVSVPLVLLNGGSEADFFKLSVKGIPTAWVSLPSPVVRIREGEQRDVNLLIRVPGPARVRAGRHRLVVVVASHAVPGDVVELAGRLTVAAVEAGERTGLLLAANSFSAVPGETTTIPIILFNQGSDAARLRVTVAGLPEHWLAFLPEPVPLPPGQENEVSVAIQPPPGTESRAGRHRFRLQVTSQEHPQELAEAECTLTVATYAAFVASLDPQQTQMGDPVRISITNLGNHPQAYGLMWRSLNDELAFETSLTRELRIPAGQSDTIELRATPRRRPLIGGGMSHPFTVRVRSADDQTQDLCGEILSRPVLPTWLVLVLFIFVLAAASWAVLTLAGAELPALPVARPLDVVPMVAVCITSRDAPRRSQGASTQLPCRWRR